MRFLNSFLTGFLILAASPAFAAPYESLAHPGQLYFQKPVTPVMERLVHLHDFLLVIITVVCIFVLGLMVMVCLRFNARANPVPSKTTHHTLLEIVWTAIPIVILIAIAIPSLKLHYYMDRTQEADMTLKVIGRQWYWEYEYPDQNGLTFESRIIPEDKLQPGQHRLLSVDNEVVVPVNTTVRVLVTGGDVIHSWAVPAFGVKTDAVPGKLNETWFRATETGTFYGQCSELCGVDHGFMPIAVKVVNPKEFAAWVAAKNPAPAANNGAAANTVAAKQE